MTAIAPGTLLTNLRAGKAPDWSGSGTLGVLALVNGIRERRMVLVSNRHVLLANGARRGETIYRARLEGDTVRASDPIGAIEDEGSEDLDVATARVTVGVDPGPVRALRRLHPLDVGPNRRVRVRKLGGATGVTRGIAISANATIDCDGAPRANTIVIRGEGGPFVRRGDSGAVIIDDQDRALGLIWGSADDDPTLAYACHIHDVERRLNVTVLTRGLA